MIIRPFALFFGVAVSGIMLSGCFGFLRPQTVGGNLQQTPAEPSLQAKAQADLALGYVELGRLDIAKSEVLKGYRIDPRNASVNNVLGLISMEIGKMDEAIGYFNQALRAEPDNPSFRNNVALLHCRNGNPSRGLQILRENLGNRLYANPEKSLMNAGLCSETMGNLTEAETYFTQAKRFNNVFLAAQEKLANIYLLTNRVDQAFRTINEVIAMASPATASQLKLAVMAAQSSGKRDEAGILQKRLLADYPEEAQKPLSNTLNQNPSYGNMNPNGNFNQAYPNANMPNYPAQNAYPQQQQQPQYSQYPQYPQQGVGNIPTTPNYPTYPQQISPYPQYPTGQ